MARPTRQMATVSGDVTRQLTNPYLTHVQIPVRAYLEELDHNGMPGTRHYVDAEETTLGRSREAAICLAHEDVSRVHARLFVRQEEAVIRDNDSRNGTFVGGTRIHECVLHEGDVLQVGPTLLRFGREPVSVRDLPEALTPLTTAPMLRAAAKKGAHG